MVERWRRVVGYEGLYGVSDQACPRGHRLEAPNLVPSRVRRGKRECLACNRAYKWAQRGRGAFALLADAEYARITQATADQLMSGGQG